MHVSSKTNHPALLGASLDRDLRDQERLAAAKAAWCGFAALFAAIGLARFGYAPFVPALVHARWFTSQQAGYLGAANLMGYVFGALLARRLARLVPLVFLLRAAMVVVGLHFLACASAVSFGWFFAWRLAAGIAGGVLMVLAAPAAIALSYPLLRGVAGGVVFTGLGLGTALSGMVVPALVRIGLATAWRSLSALVFLLTLCCWYEFRLFSLTGVSDHPSSDRAVPHQAEVSEVEWNQVWLLIATYSTAAIGFVAHTIFWVDFIARGLGLGIRAGGRYWTILGLSAACGPFLAGVVANRIGFRKALRSTLLVNAIGVAAPLFSTQSWALALSSIVTGSMAFGIVPLAAGRAMELVPHSRRQQLWAWMTAAFSIAYAASAYLFSLLFSRTGSFQLLFAIGSAVLLIGYGLAFLSYRDAAKAGIPSCPKPFAESWKLKNGTPAIIRAIRSSDELRLAKFHETLSDETVYFRYLSFIKLSERIAPAQLARTCQCDDRHSAIVAVLNHGTSGEQEIIGLGQVSRQLDKNEMELALIVGDRYQNQGLGTRLGQCLLEIGWAAGARRAVALTHLENYSMRVIARKLGFSSELDLEGHALRVTRNL